MKVRDLKPEQLPEVTEIIARNYKRSLYLTSKMLLGYKDINPRTHGDMIQALESGTKRKLVVMPRGTFKSTVGAVAYPIWRLINNPEERILISSELFTNSKNWISQIRHHLESEALTSLYGTFKSDRRWSESELLIRQRTGVFKEASITAGGIETVKVGQHYSIIIFDDLNSNLNSQTEEGRRKVIDNYKYAISLLEPDGTIVVIGTRYSAGDLIGHILENEIGVKDGAYGIRVTGKVQDYRESGLLGPNPVDSSGQHPGGS